MTHQVAAVWLTSWVISMKVGAWLVLVLDSRLPVVGPLGHHQTTAVTMTMTSQICTPIGRRLIKISIETILSAAFNCRRQRPVTNRLSPISSSTFLRVSEAPHPDCTSLWCPLSMRLMHLTFDSLFNVSHFKNDVWSVTWLTSGTTV